LENIRNAITRCQWTDWIATWVVASHHVPMVEKQQILIQKNLRSFITVKAHCSMTHLKQQKSLGLF